MSNQHTPVVGGYYMQRGFLVRITDEKDGRFGTQYIQISGGNATSGGYSGSWPATDYTPIVDPVMYAAAMQFEALREAQDHRVLGSRAEARAEQWRMAMEAIATASKAAGSQS